MYKDFGCRPPLKEGGNSVRKEKIMAKYYAVKVGVETGVYNSWDECEKQVSGYPNAIFKRFNNRKDAEAFVSGELRFGYVENEPQVDKNLDGYVKAYVDGSYDVDTGCYSAGVVILLDDEVVKLNEKYDDEEGSKLRNVAGELKGAELAIEHCKDLGIKKLVIYHDYAGIGTWGNGEWQSNNSVTSRYAYYIVESRKIMDIEFQKVKGHSGDKYNDMADYLAGKALEA